MDPLADTLADLDSFIFRLRDVAHSLDVTYGDTEQADRIARLADDLRAVHLRHKRPRVGYVRRLRARLHRSQFSPADRDGTPRDSRRLARVAAPDAEALT